MSCVQALSPEDLIIMGKNFAAAKLAVSFLPEPSAAAGGVGSGKGVADKGRPVAAARTDTADASDQAMVE